MHLVLTLSNREKKNITVTTPTTTICPSYVVYCYHLCHYHQPPLQPLPQILPPLPLPVSFSIHTHHYLTSTTGITAPRPLPHSSRLLLHNLFPHTSCPTLSLLQQPPCPPPSWLLFLLSLPPPLPSYPVILFPLFFYLFSISSSSPQVLAAPTSRSLPFPFYLSHSSLFIFILPCLTELSSHFQVLPFFLHPSRWYRFSIFSIPPILISAKLPHLFPFLIALPHRLHLFLLLITLPFLHRLISSSQKAPWTAMRPEPHKANHFEYFKA